MFHDPNRVVRDVRSVPRPDVAPDFEQGLTVYRLADRQPAA